MDSPVAELLQQGIAAARAGKRDEARALLVRAVEADERNEQAWMWLSGVIDDPDDIRTCLHNALELNPNNAQARQGLAWVDAKYGPATPKPAPEPPPVASEPPPVAATPLESAPAAPVSYTGPTTRLEPEAPPAARPAPTPPAPSAAPPASAMVESAALADRNPTTQYPCPYCGAPTALAQHNCTQCRQNLMTRAAPPDQRSLALTILGVLWMVYGVIMLLAGLLGTLGALALIQIAQTAARGRAQAGGSFSLVVLVPIVIGLLIGLFIFRIGRGLLRRERWAYYVVIGLSLLSLAGLLCNLAQFGVLVASLRNTASGLPAGNARGANIAIGAASGAVFLAIGFQVLYLLLVGLSYRDFYGPQVRLQPVVEPADDVEHYNNGIAYKNRGMWYMAVQEWHAASRKKPHDKVYLQALGLAYAQIKKVYPSSPTYLRDVEGFLTSKRADLYTLAPELEQIKLLG